MVLKKKRPRSQDSKKGPSKKSSMYGFFLKKNKV